jgi:hypothetical protein
MCSYHNQRDTTYYGQDCHYGQYFDGLLISFSQIFLHNMYTPLLSVNHITPSGCTYQVHFPGVETPGFIIKPFQVFLLDNRFGIDRYPATVSLFIWKPKGFHYF